jgi:hypothetical protein
VYWTVWWFIYPNVLFEQSFVSSMVLATSLAKPCFGCGATLASINFITVQGIGELHCISATGTRFADWILW